jgi:lipoate-protein ligase A
LSKVIRPKEKGGAGDEGPLIFLWRNEPTVTIGRHQNPWKECNVAKLDEHGVNVFRRQSGGGAVFQDLGCTTFTLLSPEGDHSIDRNFDLVVQALRDLGFGGAERKGRNDIVVDGAKVSGSAFNLSNGVFLHHGTLLVATDMGGLGKYLTPHKKKLESKGVASVAARVTNLSAVQPELSHDSVAEALCASFRKTYGLAEADTRPTVLDRSSALCTTPEFTEMELSFKDWDWRFGSSPKFTPAAEPVAPARGTAQRVAQPAAELNSIA